ncbi:MAG TPA: hypothetical protein DDY49_08965 [Paenibacillaceae bacterium]|nr:hypothetical protein [Paenibacillaceae bacterium]
MNKYLVFIQRKSTFQGDAIPAHREYLQTLRQEGTLVMAGGFIDQTGGAYLVQAENIDRARQLVQQDPMFVENECIYQVKEWNAQ